ncbi:HK97 family phage prohead protease [Mesorhizobium sp. M0700]|uniref:HK97 family phage prohead protease n=1 Tax=unclassified Mesorhizobium TaxID=325217 RepID=UPI00333BFDE9
MRDFQLYLKESTERFIAAPVEVKFASDRGAIDGYGSVFGVRDLHGDIVDRGAFTATLARHQADGTRPVMLFSHRMDKPIGVWDRVSEDDYGLKMSGRLNLDTQAGREALSLVKQDAISGLSIGFLVNPGGASVGRDGVRHLKDLDLWEVSLVAIPSNGKARITDVKSADDVTSRRDFETFLHEIGFAKAAARKLAGGGWPALSDENQQSVADLAAAVKSAILDLKGSSK